jgi:signal transduction histidine kinase
MPNKLFQHHWFDKDIMKILDRYDLQEDSARNSLDRTASLAQAAFKTTVALVILADFQSYRLKSDQPLETETVEKLFDLAHLLKEVDPELWYNFSSQPFFTESELWKPIGDFHFFSCQPICNPEGISIGWLCLFDRQHRLEDLHQLAMLKTMADMVMDELDLRVQIKKSNRIQNEIIHLAAHDLKNPLSGIMGITDHIKKQIHDSEQLDEICDLIKDSSKRMLVILDDILKSGFLENGKIQLKVTPGSFAEVVEQVVSANKQAALKKNQRFDIDVTDEPVALMDRHRMVELLDNLVNNSIKYAPRNSDIRIRIWEDSGDVIFTIYNQGVGLSEDDKSKIFHKFSRLSAKPTGGESSTGLGLSIVKMLTEMHGGKISAESEGIDKGVQFTLTLPAIRMVA